MPLDTKAPDARLRQMLERAGARLLLCAAGDARLDGLVPSGCVAQSFIPAKWDEQPTRAPSLDLSAQSAAYGQPKGVLVSHGALASYVQGLTQRLALAPGASMALVSTIAADLGHTMLFGALCGGRTLHVLPEALGFDPDGFAQYMSEHRVGILKIVPGHLSALLQATRAADVLPEQVLIVGGEACSPALVRQVRELKPACRFINHLSPLASRCPVPGPWYWTTCSISLRHRYRVNCTSGVPALPWATSGSRG